MADEVVKWWNGQPLQNETELHNILHKFNILFLYDMCCMDECEMPVHVIRAIINDEVLFNETVFPREVLKVINVSQAIDYLQYCATEKARIDNSLLKAVHRFAMCGIGGFDSGWKAAKSGEFKTGIGIDIGYEVDNVINKLYEESNEDTVLAALRFYARLMKLKPFDRGNRIVCNLLLNYYFILNGYPPVSIGPGCKDSIDTAITLFKILCDTSPLSVAMNKVIVHSWEDYLLSLEEHDI